MRVGLDGLVFERLVCLGSQWFSSILIIVAFRSPTII